MSSIKKTILAGGKEHHIQIDSSLDLEEVEITGSCSQSGKVIHISLSSLMKKPSDEKFTMQAGEFAAASPPPLQSFDMFSEEPIAISQNSKEKESTNISEGFYSLESNDTSAPKEDAIKKEEAPKKSEHSDENVIHDLFS
jgi:hypothetical protein